MPRSRGELFTTIRSEGALLPSDFLRQIAEGRDKIPGLTPEAYHLPGTERLNEAASRSWNRLLGAWGAFQAASQSLAETDPGTGITREKWLLPLFQELGYGRLLAAKRFEVNGKAYALSHAWQHTPIHLVGRNVDLDHRSPGVAGAAKISPHGLLQEFLNRSTDHLWGLLSNGMKLRILRESKSLTRQAYVEFDLAGMMDGQVYADFAILWMLCHQSRVEAERPTGCWLEKWAEEARQKGARALDTLRDGVQKAIEALGRGFLGHPINTALIGKLRCGSLSTQDYYRQLLRAVYRIIFLFVAEDRDLLLVAPPSSRERQRYLRYYSIDRLRSLAERRRGTPHVDLWRGTRLVFQKLGSDAGCPELGLPALGSYLWSTEATPDLNACELANADLLATVRSLAHMVDSGVRRPIDYKNLGPEELGSVYESLLELHPDVNPDAASFSLKIAAGHERKTSGSYYTPDSLVQCLLDSALEPVMDEAVKGKAGEGAAKVLLALKICDPAVGSGHFLIAAAHRIARRVAAVRTGDEEPSPQATRTALRDVIGRCLYGVDVNPMAAELCRVNLWLEALEPGKPLSFLDHHIRVGNSLLGATPELIAAGLPDEAFAPIEGDDKKACSELKKRNKKEGKGQWDMLHLMVREPEVEYNTLAARTRTIDEAPDTTIDEVQRKAEQFHRLVVSPDYRHKQQVADAWCAAFVWKKQTKAPFEPITIYTIRRLEADPNALTPVQHHEVERLSSQYQFFHWHLAFPEVLARGGFDCVLGNPPWERVKLQEKEWFAECSPDIANAPNAAARGKMIKALEQEDPPLFRAFREALRRSDGESALIRRTGRYPLCGRGDVNTYAAFAELNRSLLSLRGRAGFIVPTGIATDDTTKEYFGDLMSRRNLAAFYGFENEAKLFDGIDHRVNFCLMVLSRPEVQAPSFAAFIREPSLLRNPDRVYRLTAADIDALNPNTGTCPVFRTRRDADLTLAMYRRAGVLWREAEPNGNPWGLRFMAMFHMSIDSGLFRTRANLDTSGHRLVGNSFEGPTGRLLPLCEAKMIYHFNHRFGDFALLDPGEREHILPQVLEGMLANANYLTMPRYWVAEEEVAARLAGIWQRDWLLGWRDVTDARSSVRTVVASLIPRVPTANTILLAMPALEPLLVAAFYANLCSFALDYTARQKTGGTHLVYHIFKQLPVLPPTQYGTDTTWARGTILSDWLLPRVLELTYTSWDLEPFAKDSGWTGPPFRWDKQRHFLLRCELDAAFFHLYLPTKANGDPASPGGSGGAGWRQVEGETAEDLARLKASFPTPRDAVSYIMDTFPIVRRKDEERYDGDYRTKRLILEIYDAMQRAIATGLPYETLLSPPPSDPSCCHPPKEDS